MIQCRICFNDFSFDSSAKDKSRLPVQSSKCCHILCYQCVVSLYYSRTPNMMYSTEGEGLSVSCPECRTPDAYNPQDPIYSLAICELLKEREKMLKYLPDDDTRQLFEQGDNNNNDHNTTIFTMLVRDYRNVWNSMVSRIPKMTTKQVLSTLLLEACRSASWGAILLFGPVNHAGNRRQLE